MSASSQAQGDVEVTGYREWMRPQVAALFAAEYGGTPAEHEESLVRFYEHPFQRDRVIRLAALDGDEVVGFQSLFYWPYSYGGRILRSFQSGRSLVSARHRGRGIFGRLLAHLDRNREQYGCELLVGFPVEASYGSFLRKGWANPLDLSWHVKMLHPLSLLRPKDPIDVDLPFDTVPSPAPAAGGPECFELAEGPEFLEWRLAYWGDERHFFHHHREGEQLVRFDCKLNRRGRILELIVGAVRRSNRDPELLKNAVSDLLRTARKKKAVTILSLALNEQESDGSLLKALRRHGFRRIQRRIFFIVKDYDILPEARDPRRWCLFRADGDTW